MPYDVTDVQNLYLKEPELPFDRVLADHLNRREAEGWDLVAVVPMTQALDGDGDEIGMIDPMLIFRRHG